MWASDESSLLAEKGDENQRNGEVFGGELKIGKLGLWETRGLRYLCCGSVATLAA